MTGIPVSSAPPGRIMLVQSARALGSSCFQPCGWQVILVRQREAKYIKLNRRGACKCVNVTWLRNSPLTPTVITPSPSEELEGEYFIQ